jgi:DNA repair protein RadC
LSINNKRLMTLILAQNHPNGNLIASAEDTALTKKAVEAGKLL